MKKVTHFDGIELDYKMLISSEFDIDDYIGSSSVSIDGSSVMFVQAKGAMTKQVSIYSSENGWQKTDTKDLLINSVGTAAKVVTFDDSSTETYYFDFTKTPIVADRLHAASVWYRITLNLVKG